MNWLQLGSVIELSNQRKWTEPSDRTWFKFDFLPAVDGFLEVSQGDGNLTIGDIDRIPTDRSPVIISFSLPQFIDPPFRRLALKSRQKLTIVVSTLDIEPITITPDLNAISSALQSQQLQIRELSSQLLSMVNKSTICHEFTTESTTESTTLLEANAIRKFVTITNSSLKTLFIDFGDVVTKDNHATAIPPQSYYELTNNTLTKIVGVWDEVDGRALIREFI